MITLRPKTARRFFKLIEPAKFLISISAFLLLWLIASKAGLPFVVALLVSALAAYCLHFHFLDQQAITVLCPSCANFIAVDTPWLCGHGVGGEPCKNEDTFHYPFIHECGTCHTRPKAYQCHHCKKLVHFTKDEQVTQFATLLTLTKASLRSEQAAQRANSEKTEIHDLKHKLKKAQWERKIEDVTKGPRTGVLTLEEEIEQEVGRGMEFQTIERKLKAKADKRYAEDEDAREREHALIEKAIRDRIYGES